LPLPEHLPRIVIEHPLPESERLCPHHGIALERFAEVTSEQLDIVPAKVRVLRHVRGKYRCACCSGHLRTAPMPPQLLAKSIASPGLLAYVATAKFVDGLPLYHQQQQFARIGFDVSRTTLAVWTVRLGQQVQPLINLLRDELLARRYVLMDETTLQVLKEQGKTAESKSYLWAQMSGEGAAPIVLFEYDPTRSREVPKRLLEGFCGTLHTDGYAGYDAVVTEHGLTRLYCWVHVRRRFVEVLKSLGLNPKKLPDKPPPKARRALKAEMDPRTWTGR
jgi:transposase